MLPLTQLAGGNRRRYVVVGQVDAYGVRRNSKAPVEYITLIPPPGVQGSEVGFQVPVRLRSTLTVRKVIRTNRLSHRMIVMAYLEEHPCRYPRQ